MNKTTPADLSRYTGEELLLLRIRWPHLKGLIEQELDCRDGLRRLFSAQGAAAQPLSLAAVMRVA